MEKLSYCYSEALQYTVVSYESAMFLWKNYDIVLVNSANEVPPAGYHSMMIVLYYSITTLLSPTNMLRLHCSAITTH